MSGFIKELKYSIKSQNYKLNYHRGNYKKVVWLIGSGRSGTTWAANLINWNKGLREMFEPFHPKFVKETKEIPPHLYVRPDDENHLINSIAPLIFSGKLCNRRVDSDNKFKWTYDGLLVKDIFANLFAFWAAKKFPNLKIILLIRNPFAVALSKFRMKNAFWLNEPKKLFDQPELYEDFLQPFENLFVHKCDDFIERQILIWSVLYYVPLNQFKREQIHTVFYSDLFTDPTSEMKKIFKFIEPESDPENNTGWTKIFGKPSRVAWEQSNIVKKESPLTAWKKEISPTQFSKGKGILEQFGFGNLFEDNGIPNHDVIDKLLQKTQIKSEVFAKTEEKP